MKLGVFVGCKNRGEGRRGEEREPKKREGSRRFFVAVSFTLVVSLI